ncbi:glycoside hydrolase family 15 protein [Geobacter hydrogenophilus]|uniref:Glucoamylase n=1 Tax=Geobacter hydrogenophilus TaxID=40983 RepID=A0A9W6FXA2_9BACT|nr:glycoside hydrolase family 15 protein [Geobacter hydrogenophilus]MBT0895406.1 glycoside hydrolase family 15 protein [Geobacter hydrogenophilus]GLI36513.1 glucoamylase [Geobacter hydrogenophilus]
MTKDQKRSYPPIRDYAFIADCHSSALVSRAGSIDWCCMPRIDSASCFGRLLDWEKGGYCRIHPKGGGEVSRRYLERTLILETRFKSADGEVRMIDFFPMREGGRHNPYQQIIRILEGVRGEIEVALECAPCFDYGAMRPWIRRKKDHYLAMGGQTGLLISGDYCFEFSGRHRIGGSCTLEAGERRYLSILYGRPEDLDDGLVSPPSIEELDERLEETIDWWHKWTEQLDYTGPEGDLVLRSAIVLKGLSNAPSGAIAAAATTSLPEAPGGSRNWDYRYSWVRDSSFTVRTLAELGFADEADGFRRFMERSCAGSAEELQILFGVGGERRLHEYEIESLEGYRGARPVRVGNAAEQQLQLDVYGELLDLAWSWHKLGESPDDDYWEFLVELVDAATRQWRNPDRGIWEIRGEPRHFVLSKAMCWVAIERGIRLAKNLEREAPVDEWQKACDQIRSEIEEKGYDRERGVFIQAYDTPIMDASLLLLPIFGFIEADDKRMVRTVAAIRQDLEQDGLLRRYRADDGLDGEEGVFLACSFWLAECLAAQGQIEETRRVFRRAADTANDLGLFSEEYDTRSGEMLGNFPQALTHLSLIAAAVTLGKVENVI